MKAELDIKPFLKAINDFRIAEQQPCGVQVVEWVGLVAFFPLGNIFGFGCAVFAEEVGGFGFVSDCHSD